MGPAKNWGGEKEEKGGGASEKPKPGKRVLKDGRPKKGEYVTTTNGGGTKAPSDSRGRIGQKNNS